MRQRPARPSSLTGGLCRADGGRFTICCAPGALYRTDRSCCHEFPPPDPAPCPADPVRPGRCRAPGHSPSPGCPGAALRQRGLGARGGGRRHRPRLRPGPCREKARAAVLGCHLVPAVQSVEGHTVQPPGLRRPGEELRGRACGRRPAGRPEAGGSLQGARLPHGDPDDGRGCRDLPPAGRCRCAANHGGAAGRVVGGAAAEGGAGRCARWQGPVRQRMAHARLPWVGGRRGPTGARQGAAGHAGRAGAAQRGRRRGCARR